jgi:hypothetical protein
MISNIDKYQKDLDRLIKDRELLLSAMQYECLPNEFMKAVKKIATSDADVQKVIKTLPSFNDRYQTWYSEALAVIELLLPNRVDDFARLYAKPKAERQLIMRITSLKITFRVCRSLADYTKK